MGEREMARGIIERIRMGTPAARTVNPTPVEPTTWVLSLTPKTNARQRSLALFTQ
jgi:hypothetical protein